MAQNKVNNVYYGTTDESKNYETDKESGTITLGDIQTQDTLVDDYVCSATINIGLDGDMKPELKTNDLVLVIIQGNKESEYDLSEINTSPTFSFALNNIEPIKAYLKFTNQETDQSGLAGKTLNVTISITDFVCEVDKSVLATLQKTTDSDHLKTVADNDELIRYVGTYEEVKNNYICFGTTEKDTCTSDKDTYMYRIIGITTDNVNTELGLVPDQLKIIKATPSNTSQVWHSSNSDVIWDSADVQKIYLNATFFKTITDITTKVETHNWSELISNPQWYIADNNVGSWILTTEKNKTTLSANHKVGLMYASDYYNGCNKSLNTSCWLYVKNGISASSSLSGNALYEWTMSRYGNALGNCYAWSVLSGGTLNGTYYVDSSYAVRPVFYLIPDVTLTGEGTETNPFVISEG